MNRLRTRRLDTDGVRHVHVSGELDLASIEELKQHLDGCADGERLVVDTTGLTFIDSTGLGALVGARNERGPDLFQVIPGPATRRLFDLAGLQRHFGLEEDKRTEASCGQPG